MSEAQSNENKSAHSSKREEINVEPLSKTEEEEKKSEVQDSATEKAEAQSIEENIEVK